MNGALIVDLFRRFVAPGPVGQFRSSRGQVSREEVERLVYEEYRSERDGESVAVVQHDRGKIVGVCAMQNELKVEYYGQEFGRWERCLKLLLAAFTHALYIYTLFVLADAAWTSATASRRGPW